MGDAGLEDCGDESRSKFSDSEGYECLKSLEMMFRILDI